MTYENYVREMNRPKLGELVDTPIVHLKAVFPTYVRLLTELIEALPHAKEEEKSKIIDELQVSQPIVKFMHEILNKPWSN